MISLAGSQALYGPLHTAWRVTRRSMGAAGALTDHSVNAAYGRHNGDDPADDVQQLQAAPLGGEHGNLLLRNVHLDLHSTGHGVKSTARSCE